MSRGKYELQVVHALLQGAATINRLASDIVLYASSEFGFVQLSDVMTTGSSIMPQKKNPDIAELARATMHRLSGEMQVLIGVPANLPSGYHRDLQLTKAAVMKSVLITSDLMEAARGLVEGMTFDLDRLNGSKDPALFATAVALMNVASGVPFRDAYKAAAEQKDAWAHQADLSLTEVYKTSGTPGRTDSAGVRSRLQGQTRNT
jgi:argininosuccinate lyase